MRKFFFLFCLIIFSQVNAAENSISLEKAPIDRNDFNSIRRGAKFFAANCMVCHTLIYLRYNKLAQQEGVLYEKMPVNITTWPFDKRPPDLSLEASVRGVDWIYTYLHSFYVDEKRPTGANNLLLVNSVMTNILAPYQGQQILATDQAFSQRSYINQMQWYDLLTLKSHGSMTPAEFDATITDVVNFLAYAAEPYYVKQHFLGYWIIGFLILFFILVFLLKREYWKDVDRSH